MCFMVIDTWEIIMNNQKWDYRRIIISGAGKTNKPLIAGLLARKNGESYAIVMAWLRTRIAFEILRSVLLCVRGSRVPFKKRDEAEMLNDFRLNVDAAGIFFELLNNFSFKFKLFELFRFLLMTELFILCRFYSYFYF